ncbi:ABC transporter substrate-binding protein [Actinokineospora bangkokensis]|uniref:ABC transporter substrate-binding protein n=1 Tax=Actinokineospora bangkokensis TaxID=1193682 RepID=A0A1Q9LQI0_9PSEU|nr:ABC transporter substrate-binding protein [Actinokineospora bangkokensis]OLR94254.1 ABC transporter substrate-binding protein [Actinokineospora bangkokensis]
MTSPKQSRPARGWTRRAAALLTAVLAATAACATREQPATPAPTAAQVSFPVTVTPPGGAPLTVPARPERIVSLSSTATEGLFALGAGGQVVAVDDQSSYPAEAPRTDLSGLTPNVEAIAAKSPDLVVASGDPGGLVAGLAKLRVPVLVLASAKTLDDVYTELDVLGRATGHPADDLVARMRSDIERVVAATPKKRLTYYHELDQTLYSATSSTFIGQVYGLFGLTNIADAADATGSGYPQLSAEYVIAANPSLVFLADVKCCGQSAQTVAARPGWSTVDAVRAGRVTALDDDIASRWGPRVVDLVRVVADAVAKA